MNGCLVLLTDTIKMPSSLEMRDAIVKYTQPIEVILSITEGLVGKDKKKQVNYDLFSLFAPQPGLEPGT